MLIGITEVEVALIVAVLSLIGVLWSTWYSNRSLIRTEQQRANNERILRREEWDREAELRKEQRREDQQEARERSDREEWRRFQYERVAAYSRFVATAQLLIPVEDFKFSILSVVIGLPIMGKVRGASWQELNLRAAEILVLHRNTEVIQSVGQVMEVIGGYWNYGGLTPARNAELYHRGQQAIQDFYVAVREELGPYPEIPLMREKEQEREG